MAAHVTKQVTTRARGSAVSADVPILASKITAPGVPGWVLPRPRITKLIAEGRRWCPLTVVTGPPRRGQDDGPGAVGGGRTRDGGLGRPG